eukprot:777862_1
MDSESESELDISSIIHDHERTVLNEQIERLDQQRIDSHNEIVLLKQRLNETQEHNAKLENDNTDLVNIICEMAASDKTDAAEHQSLQKQLVDLENEHNKICQQMGTKMLQLKLAHDMVSELRSEITSNECKSEMFS